MAVKSSTITLEVLLNEKDIAKKLAAAFEGSPRAIAAIAKAVSPLEKGLGRVHEKQKAINSALRSAVSLTDKIAKNYNAIAAKSGGISDDMRQLGALAKGKGPTGVKARQELQSRGDGAMAEIQNPTSPQAQMRATGQLLQAKVQLANAAESLLEDEESLTSELRKQVIAHINIARARLDNSPDSIRELVNLERQLAGLAEDTSEGLVKQGKYAELLLRTEKQLTDEATRGAKAERARVAELINVNKLLQDLPARASILRGELRDQEASFGFTNSQTDEGASRRSASLSNQVTLTKEIQNVERQIERDSARAAARRSADLRQEIEGRINASRAGQGRAGNSKPGSDRAGLVAIERQLALLAGDTADDYALQNKYSKLLIAAKREIASIDKQAATAAQAGAKADLRQYDQQKKGLLFLKKEVDTRPGGSGSPISATALKAVHDEVKSLQNDLQALTRGTREYQAALDNLKIAQGIAGSQGADAIDYEINAQRQLQEELKKAIALRNVPGEVGNRANDAITAIAKEAKESRERESILITEISVKLENQLLDDKARLDLLNEQTKAIVRQNEAGEITAQINSRAAGRGTGRASLARQRREDGFDSYSALVDIGRVAQDAPYGFEGIANNIGPLIESMTLFYGRVQQATGGVGTLRTSLKALARDLLFTPIGIVALFNILVLIAKGLPSIIAFIDKIVTGLDKARSVASDFNKEISQQSGSQAVAFLTDEQADDTRQNADKILVELRRLQRERQALMEAPVDEDGPLNAATGIGRRLGAALFSWITTDKQQGLTEINSRIAETEELYKGVGEAVAEAEGRVNSLTTAIVTGATEPIQRSIRDTQQEIRKQFLETQLAGQRTQEGRVRVSKALFELETQIQKEEIRRQLQLEYNKLRDLIRAYNQAALIRRASAAELAVGRGLIEDQQAVITQGMATLDSFDDFRQGAWLNDLDSLQKKEKKSAEELAQIARDAVREIENLQNEVAGLRNENNNALEGQQFAQRRNQLRLDDYFKGIERARAVEDFREQVKDLANRGALIGRFQAQQNALGLEQSRARAIEERRIQEDEANYAIAQQRRVLDQRVSLSSANVGLTFGNIREQAELDISYRRQQLELEGQIAELEARPDADFTPIDREVLKLLRDELEIRERIYGIEKDRSLSQQDRTLEQLKQDARDQVSALRFELEDLQTQNVFDSQERERTEYEIALRRQLAEIDAQKERETREISANDNADQRLVLTEALEIASQGRRTVAWQEYYNNLKDMEFQLLTDRERAYVDYSTEQIDAINSTAQLMQSNWEARTRQRLVAEGQTEEQITETIKTAGAKRRKIVNTIARAQIVASTAVAAMDAFEGTMKAFKFLGPGALPLALGAAGIAVAFGAAQYNAVGLDSIKNNTSGSGNGFNIGLESAPGVQASDPFTTADPYYRGGRNQETIIIGGMADMTEQINKLGTEILESSQRIAARPAIVGYTPDAASTFVEAGAQHVAFVTRG